MNGKSSKFATAALSALLYTQGLLCIAGVTAVVFKDRLHADPAIHTIVVAASSDAQLR